MSLRENRVCGIACSVFQEEIEMMRDKGKIDIQFAYLDSALHIEPAKLREKLDQAIAGERGRGNRVILVYGDCHPYMSESASGKNICRIRGLNCASILLGRDRYRELRKTGAFIFLPEWTARWREIFTDHLGLNRENAKSLMGEMHTKLVCIDTGISPVPHDILKEITEYIGLPMEIVRVSPEENLLVSVKEALEIFSGV